MKEKLAIIFLTMSLSLTAMAQKNGLSNPNRYLVLFGTVAEIKRIH